MQPHFYSRALSLAALDAPSEAKAMALLLSWHKDKEVISERQASRYLHLCETAAATHPKVVLPEIHKILDLEGALPHPIRSRRLAKTSGTSPAPAPAPTAAQPNLVDLPGPSVEWPLEGLTPWISSSASFRDAVAFSDNPERWHEAAAQVQVGPCEKLKSDGARWRKRLTKRTDFGMPFTSDLVAVDTIDITAEGHDARDGSGFRRYSYFLHSAAGVPGVLDIKRDEGWIEIAGDANGVQIRVQKRVTVVRPANDELACILSAGFLAELWLWAIGFCGAVGKPSRQPIGPALKRDPNDKLITVVPGDTYNVCVMGGGPAGLACAWLLKNPKDLNDPKGRTAWSGPVNVSVRIVEKEYLPGGKAASGRRVDDLQFRIEEHGLHMALGCYPNLLEILKWTDGLKNLDAVRKVVIPCGPDPSKVDDAFEFELKPWDPSPEARPPYMKRWIRQTRRGSRNRAVDAIRAVSGTTGSVRTAAKSNAKALIKEERDGTTLWQSIGDQEATVARTRPRPVMRMFAATNDMLAPALQTQGQGAIRSRQHLSLIALGKVVSLAATSEISLGAADSGSRELGLAANELVALATLMRSFARAALPWNQGTPKERMTGELLEFGTTVLIGLAADAKIPMWALDDPNDFPNRAEYAQWVRLVQKNLDSMTLADWLNKHGVAPGFALESRVIGAITAGLFTGADGIGAGTFVNGFLRLLLTYKEAPFYRFIGGTGQAVISPIFNSLSNDFRLEGTVKSIEINGKKGTEILVGGNPAPAPADFVGPLLAPRSQAFPADYRVVAGCGKDPVWVIRPASPPQPTSPRAQPQPSTTMQADIFVLAIPPFDQPIAGLPKPLADDLAKIRHKSTVSLQCWTDQKPKFDGSLFAGFAMPFRCVAAMDKLTEDGGNRTSDFAKSPVYYCGDLVQGQEKIWTNEKFAAWADTYAPVMQGGTSTSKYGRVNFLQSQRYVDASPATQKVRRYVFDTGVDNLWLAGDWTRTAMCCGSIEAAVTSGLEAARDILAKLGCTVNFPIVGSILD